MATESPLIHDGSQNTLSTANDARRSSITGTTLSGPNGSAQFYWLTESTTVDRTVAFASTAPTTTPWYPYGVLQNTPQPGGAADIGIFGITKLIAGTTTIVRGSQISPSSTVSGLTSLWATGQVYLRAGIALETPSAVGQVFTALIYGPQGGSS